MPHRHYAMCTASGRAAKWFIEGDIKGCFDNIDHAVLLSILREKIHDGRFLILVENLLKAGYLEEWDYRPTLSGTPQGGIVSPLLANIYLDRLDKFVEETLIPEYTRGAETQEDDGDTRAIRQRDHRLKAEGRGSSEDLPALCREDAGPSDVERPVRSGLSPAAVHPVCRRFPARLRWTEG